MKKQLNVEILSNEEIAENTYLLKIPCPEDVLKFFRPGQFAHIGIPGAGELLLRRPLSINSVDYEKKEAHIAYHAAGKGTTILRDAKAGSTLDVLMPLGNGFAVKPAMRKIWLVGGGIGCAPLKSVFGKYADREYKAFLGFQCKSAVYQESDFKKYADVNISTDDGSYGTHGFITDVLREALETAQPDVILACGPLPFFRALVKVTRDVPVQVSMEQHMGCGTGGCAVCVCSVGGENRRVGVEGAGFDSREVDVLW